MPGEPTEHLHLAFATAQDAAVGAFHEAATGAGFRSNGAPGERPQYHPGYYAAYVLDPDGNNVERILGEGYRFLMASPVRSLGPLEKGRKLSGR